MSKPSKQYLLPGWARGRVSGPTSDRLESGLAGALIGAFRSLPLPAALRLGRQLGRWLGPQLPRAGKVRENLRVVFPEASEAELKRLAADTFGHAGEAMVELANIDRIWREADARIDYRIHPGGRPLSPERPTVFATAHVAAWQLTPLLGRHYGLEVPIIYAPVRNAHLDARLKKLRNHFGGPLVESGGAMRALIKALQAGQSVGLTVDTRLAGGEPIAFFGRASETNTLPARLALRTGADFVPVRGERLGGGCYRLHVYPRIEASDPAASLDARASDLTRQLNQRFEDWIRAEPGEWLCLKRRWGAQ